MSIQSVLQGTFSFFQNLPIVVETTAAHLSSDAGLLAFREFDEKIVIATYLNAIQQVEDASVARSLERVAAPIR